MGFSVHFGSGGHHHNYNRHSGSHHHHHHHRHYHGGGGVVVAGPVAKFFMGVIFSIVGGLILFFSINAYKEINAPGYVEGKGRVVDYVERYDSDSGYMYAIVVEYVVDGQKYQVTSSSYSTSPRYLGAVIDIKYHPDNPKAAKITEAGENDYLMPGIIGGIFALVGVIMLVSGIKSSFTGSNGNKESKEKEEDVI